MLPGWTRMGPVLPFTGERIVVYSRFSPRTWTLALCFQIGGLGVGKVLAARRGFCAFSVYSGRPWPCGRPARRRVGESGLVGARIDLEQKIAGS